MESSSALLSAIAPEEAYRQFLGSDLRPDGRALMEVRKTTVQSGVFPNTPGSAIAKLGDTKVAAAVTLQIGKPADATPKQGEIGKCVVQTCMGERGDGWWVGVERATIRRRYQYLTCSTHMRTQPSNRAGDAPDAVVLVTFLDR